MGLGKVDKDSNISGITQGQMMVYGSTDGGTTWFPIKVDATGILLISRNILNRGFTPASIGANTIVTVGATERIKVYKAILSPSADITGEVYLSVGSIKIGTIQNPKSGGQYILLSAFPDFEYGAIGDDLILTLPSATTVSLNVAYEIS